MLRVEGEIPLKGEIHISGSKNAAIPALAASLLTNGVLTLNNIPRISDIHRMLEILQFLNVKLSVNWQTHQVTLRADEPASNIPSELSKLLRGATILMGSLVARTGYVKFETFGGCPLGERPIDFHLSALEMLGAKVTRFSDAIEIKAKELRGANIELPFPSVGATENILLASSLAKGKTILRNAALEPEVLDLIILLQTMGISINVNKKTRTIQITGQSDCDGAKHHIIPDRIEAGTYAVAAGITGGNLLLKDASVDHLIIILEKLQKIGLIIDMERKNEVRISSPNKALKAIDIVTDIYPGFPTDMQPQMMAILTQATGTSHIQETIWERRFHHVPELVKMGANIEINDRESFIRGPTNLKGTTLSAIDIRGGAALILAALTASGNSYIDGFESVERGYEEIASKLHRVGAIMEIVTDEQ